MSIEKYFYINKFNYIYHLELTYIIFHHYLLNLYYFVLINSSLLFIFNHFLNNSLSIINSL